jgi:subtilisin family serine protease
MNKLLLFMLLLCVLCSYAQKPIKIKFDTVPLVSHTYLSSLSLKPPVVLPYADRQYMNLQDIPNIDLSKYITRECPCYKDLKFSLLKADETPDDNAPPPPIPKMLLPSQKLVLDSNQVKAIKAVKVKNARNLVITDNRQRPETVENSDENDIPTQKQPKDPTSTVSIAVIDTGVDPSWESLTPFLSKGNGNSLLCDQNDTKEGIYGINMINGAYLGLNTEPIDEDNHGSFINHILSGRFTPFSNDMLRDEKNKIAIKILNVKYAQFATGKEDGLIFDALCGIHYALKKGVKVINASWKVNSTPENEAAIKVLFIPTMKAIKDAGAILVVSAGNDGLDIDGDIKTWPACFSSDPTYADNVISVGANNPDAISGPNTNTAFTNYGKKNVQIYTTGENVMSKGLKSNGGKTLIWKGTSFATAYTSRIAALMMALNPRASIGTIKANIIKYHNATNSYRNLLPLNLPEFLIPIPNGPRLPDIRLENLYREYLTNEANTQKLQQQYLETQAIAKLAEQQYLETQAIAKLAEQQYIESQAQMKLTVKQYVESQAITKNLGQQYNQIKANSIAKQNPIIIKPKGK